jgi:hypothetical protein
LKLVPFPSSPLVKLAPSEENFVKRCVPIASRV